MPVAITPKHIFCQISCFLMHFFKIIPPHAHSPAAAVASPPTSAPSQPTNVASVSPSATAVTCGSSTDDLALADACCAGSLFPADSLYFALDLAAIDRALAAGQAWHLFSQISLDTDLFLCRFHYFWLAFSPNSCLVDLLSSQFGLARWPSQRRNSSVKFTPCILN